jgi:wobble nucleotide-excising tRNase
MRSADERRTFWGRFLRIEPIDFDSDTFIQDWQTARNGFIALLNRKAGSPLEPIGFSQELSDAIRRFNSGRQRLLELHQRLFDDNARIATLKAETVGANAIRLQQELAQLEASRRRHLPTISPHCDHYQTEFQAKVATERLRDQTRLQIDAHRATAFPAYQTGINAYLRRFGVGFHLDNVSPVDTRGGATCNYDVVINNISIPIASAQSNDQPCFRNTLSAGDRNALALSFFFASLDSDPNLSNKIVVLDDPLSSLDEHRWFSTMQEIRTLATRVEQVILLSHDKSFLGRVWEGIGRASSICTPLKIQRSGNTSVIEEWDVSTASVTEHDRNHRLLREYMRNGPAHNSRQVAIAVRPFLEGFVRVAFPEHCPPQARAFSNFVATCRQRLGATNQILNQEDYNELFELVEYGNLFHHETNTEYDEAVPINDGQLQVFVERALNYASG